MLRALFSVALLFAASSASAQTTVPPGATMDPPRVVTTGEATVKRPPDRVWITVAVESRAKTAREAQKLNSDAMAAVMQKFKGAALGNDAVRTTSYNLQPEFDYRDGRQTLRGYVARNSVEVRVDEIARAGEVLELAVGAGATTVSGVRFDLKDRDGAEREALRQAVADARARAEAAAAGTGMRIDRVLKIEEQRGFAPEPRQMMMREAAAVVGDAAGQPPISPGDIEIRALVTLTASIR